jgi:hypothetical protein
MARWKLLMFNGNFFGRAREHMFTIVGRIDKGQH